MTSIPVQPRVRSYIENSKLVRHRPVLRRLAELILEAPNHLALLIIRYRWDVGFLTGITTWAYPCIYAKYLDVHGQFVRWLRIASGEENLFS